MSATDEKMDDQIKSASADEMEDLIESAEEASDIKKLLDIISTCSHHRHQESPEDWDVPSEASLDSFYRVIKGSKSDGGDGGLELPMNTRSKLMHSLQEWREEEAIVEVALGCIAAVGSQAEENFDETVDGIDVELIVNIMQTYEDESAIQEQACLAIKGLAEASEGLKARLLEVEGMGEELKAAKDRITNERNKKYVGQAAAALGLEL